jgi:hypothetical protein
MVFLEKDVFLTTHCFSSLEFQSKVLFLLTLKKLSKILEFYWKNSVFALITYPPGLKPMMVMTLNPWLRVFIS